MLRRCSLVHRLGLAIWVTALACSMTAQSAHAQGAVAQEYAIKAAFLANFANFVEWPAAAFEDGDDAIRIGVVGEDPFGATLDAIASKKAAGGRNYEVHRYRNAADVEACHILFISRTEEARVDKILDALDMFPTLTVSETKRFLKRGGIINFFIEQDVVRFEINQGAAEEVDLKIKSKLLRLAKKAKR